ncbi:MAG: hypothetical protein OXI54_05010 [Chloroflexota bacterium]|nr:hypothetical protein [Chloroflexota bacterium]MDE2683489.1 hypothetical protein [Chloroflexota bacterium]
MPDRRGSGSHGCPDPDHRANPDRHRRDSADSDHGSSNRKASGHAGAHRSIEQPGPVAYAVTVRAASVANTRGPIIERSPRNRRAGPCRHHAQP